MADKVLPITCEVVASNVEVGSGKKDTNEIVLKITNTSAEPISFSGLGARGEFSIAISIGLRAEDLVATAEDSTAINIPPPSNWQSNPYKNLEGQATWSYKLPRTVLSANDNAQLKLTNFESHTDPGKAKVTIGAKVSGYNDYKTTVEVEKKAEQFDLLYFTADPPYIITDDDRNNFKLTWNAVKAERAVLYSNNNIKLQEFQEASGGFQSEKPFTYANEKPSLTTLYKLVVTDRADGGKSKEQQLTVQVLNPGWYSANFRYGYPAVLCSMDGVKLYGIFINKGKAGLYSSEYPYAGWMLENSDVPDGMETSPAVHFRNRLWLIGGSTADPDARSSMVWCYEKDTGEWRSQQSPWSARMGHACVVDNISNPNRLFVLGGNDDSGTSLNEVWTATLNGEQLVWPKEPHNAPWQPRCMFAATFFNNKIWIYGGATAPFSDPLEDMWVSGNGESWEKYKTIPEENNTPIGKPIGSTLQVIKNKLNLIGSFRRGTIVTPRQFILEEAQELWQGSGIEQPWDGQEGNTFSLLSVQHKGLIFLRSLNYQTRDNPTKLSIYLPQNT